ncbi:hypothetical protein S101520_03012 [Lactiplantibacillus plantarum subsp. plantarum]|nr:hypothetical protein S101520_03012 [Lactiplantibacillus plantarum subsp. plantarum]
MLFRCNSYYVEAMAGPGLKDYLRCLSQLVSKYHTTVIGPMGKPLEVQIRTEEENASRGLNTGCWLVQHTGLTRGQTGKVQ